MCIVAKCHGIFLNEFVQEDFSSQEVIKSTKKETSLTETERKKFYCVRNEIICQCFCKRALSWLMNSAEKCGKTNIFRLNVGNHAWCVRISGCIRAFWQPRIQPQTSNEIQFQCEFERVPISRTLITDCGGIWFFLERERDRFYTCLYPCKGCECDQIYVSIPWHSYPLSTMTYYTHFHTKLLYIEWSWCFLSPLEQRPQHTTHSSLFRQWHW